MKVGRILPIFFLLLLTLGFFWQVILNKVPIPADVIVGIYYPWRDHIWKDHIAGVPFKNGTLSDVVSIIYPWRIYAMELLKQKILPLWIPHALSGTPLLANFQSAVFYPFNFLFFLLDNVTAWSVYIMIQPLLASIFMFLFLKNLKLGNWASILGATVFAFSGFMLVWLEYGIVGHAGLWLPLIFLSIDKLFLEKKFEWVILGAASLSFSLLAGYPQISFYLLLIAGLYAIFCLTCLFKTETKSGITRLLFSLILMFSLSLGLASIQLVPGLELLHYSIRESDPTIFAFNWGVVPLKNLVTFLAPDFFGNPSTLNFWGDFPYNDGAGYVGIVPLVLAGLGFLFCKRRQASFFRLSLIIFLILSFITPVALLPSRSKIPGFTAAVPARALFLVTFCLAVFSAFGLEGLLRKEIKTKKVLLIFLVFGLFYTLLWLFVFRARRLSPKASWLTYLSVSKRNLILPTAIFVGGSIVFLSKELVEKILNRFLPFLKPIWLPLSLLFLATFDLFRFGFKYDPFSDKEFLYSSTELTQFLQSQEGLDRFVGLIPSSMFIPYNLLSFEGYDPLHIRWFSEYANAVNEPEFEKVTSGSRWVTINNINSPLLNVAGVKYFLAFKGDAVGKWEPQPWRYPEPKFKMVFQYGKSQIYENTESLPRSFIAHKFKVISDKEGILKTLADSDFDASNTLILEETPAIKLEQPDDRTLEFVKINKDSYLQNRVTIQAYTQAPGLLFLSDNFYPGWRAYLDGKEIKIYRADYTFRAVSIPKGEHIIRFIYDPLPFKMGVYLSLGTLVFLIVGGIRSCQLKKE
jgi:hypothetical protein